MTDILQKLDAVEYALSCSLHPKAVDAITLIPEIRAALEARENKLPASYDIIIQAINEYTGYMLDDDYDAPTMLNKIMNKIIDRAQLHGIIPTPPKGGSDGHN